MASCACYKRAASQHSVTVPTAYTSPHNALMRRLTLLLLQRSHRRGDGLLALASQVTQHSRVVGMERQPLLLQPDSGRDRDVQLQHTCGDTVAPQLRHLRAAPRAMHAHAHHRRRSPLAQLALPLSTLGRRLLRLLQAICHCRSRHLAVLQGKERGLVWWCTSEMLIQAAITLQHC